MAYRARVAGGLLFIAVIAAAVLAGMRYEMVEAVRDRLATDYTVGDAQFSAPGVFVWPRLTEQGALSSCDLCVDPGLPGITAEYGVLRTDPGIMDVHRQLSQARFQPQRRPLAASGMDRAVAPVRFLPGLRTPPHIKKCASYELIDDATGWILDAGQNPAS